MWQKSFNDEFEKLAESWPPKLKTYKDNGIEVAGSPEVNSFIKNLGIGAVAGAVSTTVTHPTEHKLYGKGMKSFPHYVQRLKKGTIASTAGYGTAFYLKDKFF